MNNEIFHVVPKSRAGADEKHDINFYMALFQHRYLYIRQPSGLN